MWRRVLRWILVVLGVLVCAILGALYYFGSVMRSDTKIAAHLESIPHVIHRDTIDGQSMRWLSVGDTTADHTILFFHGAPGSWMDFSDYLVDSQLLDRVHMIVVDRPGYGASGYGEAETGILRQAEIAHRIVGDTTTPALIVGYSYGGPVAGAYAAEYGREGDRLLLLAPVIHPDEEPIFWFNGLLDTWVAKAVLPAFITVANDEKISHPKALDEIRGMWRHINIPTTHVHSEDDWIAPYAANLGWSKEQIPAPYITQVIWSDDSHFLPNNVKDRLLPIILDLF